jgi:hypothetical protein
MGRPSHVAPSRIEYVGITPAAPGGEGAEERAQVVLQALSRQGGEAPVEAVAVEALAGASSAREDSFTGDLRGTLTRSA